jgi:hypothetical protein
MYKRHISSTAIAATLSFILMVTVYFGEKYTNIETVKNEAVFSFIDRKGTLEDVQKEDVLVVIPPKIHQYIEIINSCGPYFEGTCVNLRSGPGENFRSVTTARDGVTLKTSGVTSVDGQTWYKIVFDEFVRYPERLSSSLYVSGDYVRTFSVAEELIFATTTRRIIIDRSDQTLYAYDADELYMSTKVSTGLSDLPTPRGNFTIFSKTPSRYMQGPLPGISDQKYDLPGVPFTMYFTKQGGAIHGAYWHDKFGQVWSHGCVNLNIKDAEKLYAWTPLGAKVLVRD